MKKITASFGILILVVLAAGLLRADVSLEQAKSNYKAARKAYFEARAAAGLSVPTNRTSRTATAPAPANNLVLSKKQSAFLSGRRIAVSRDTTTIPGSVITTWHRNGKPDVKLPSVETNVLKRIVGREQNNPLHNAIADFRAKYANASNRYEIAEARITSFRAGLTSKRDAYAKKRDEAALPTTKAIYQAFVDVIDEILNTSNK